MLICKVKRTDQTRAELYGKAHKYPDLKLFDLADLAAVGIDGAALTIGEEQPARFWAVYELSDKTNKAGNPYKDVLTLEPIAGPATTTSAAVGDPELLSEIRAIRALLQVLAEAQGLTLPTPPAETEPEPDGNGHDAGELDRAFPRYGDNSPVGDNPAEVAAYQAHVKETGAAPASLEALRAWTKARNARINGKQH